MTEQVDEDSSSALPRRPIPQEGPSFEPETDGYVSGSSTEHIPQSHDSPDAPITGEPRIKSTVPDAGNTVY